MEFNPDQCEPAAIKSTKLYQEVQIQSPYCDVTIKVGSWEKRFHWHVLIASPFFECIYMSNYLETHTGTVELKNRTVPCVEAALLFLYGIRPTLSMDNVDDILDLAEFFLIPNLKASCVQFLRKESVITHENCFYLIELSCVYEIVLKTDFDSFVRRNLTALVQQPSTLNVTVESLTYLLKDPTLSYLPVNEWFNFLVRWTHHISSRRCFFSELLKLLDLNACDVDYVKDTIETEPLVKMANLQLQYDAQKTHETFLIVPQYANTLACLNMRTLTWHWLDTVPFTPANPLSLHKLINTIDGVRTSEESTIYKTINNTSESKVILQDLSRSGLDKHLMEVVLKDENGCEMYTSKSALANNTIAAISIIPFQTTGVSFGQSSTKRHSVLYIGTIDSTVADMRPILTVKNYQCFQVCINCTGIVGMISPNENTVHVYNIHTCQLHTLHLKMDNASDFVFDMNLYATKDGCILISGKQAVCISRTEESSFKEKYIINDTETSYVFGYPESSFKFCFDGDLLVRLKNNKHGIEEIHYIPYDELKLKTSERTEKLLWRPLPLPSVNICPNISQQGVRVDRISLRKGELRCQIQCPHCEPSTETTPFRTGADLIPHCTTSRMHRETRMDTKNMGLITDMV